MIPSLIGPPYLNIGLFNVFIYYPYNLPNNPAIPVAVLKPVANGLAPPIGAGAGATIPAIEPKPPPYC
jgi:hypothetical protein